MPQDPRLPFPASVPPVGGAQQDTLQVSWRHPAGLVGLAIVNFVLRILTLNIYSFWAKTEVRKRIWSAIRLNGEPLHYTGTGKELLLGFLVVFAVVIIPTLIVSVGAVLLLGQGALLAAFQGLLYVFFLLLTGVAIHRAQRYRLSRTEWRGIRGRLTGSSWGYAWTYFWTALLVPLTLGWIMPWRSTKLQGILTSNTHLGSRPLRFLATSGPLYGRFAALWLGSLVISMILAVTIGGSAMSLMRPENIGADGRPSVTAMVTLIALIYGGFLVALLLFAILTAWYRAGMMNHFAAHTELEGARFSLQLTGGGLIWVTISNFLILLLGAIIVMLIAGVAIAGVVLGVGLQPANLAQLPPMLGSLVPLLLIFLLIASFGLLTPVTYARTMRYVIERLSIEGTVPLSDIAQGARDEIRRGEGLAQAFDVDAF